MDTEDTTGRCVRILCIRRFYWPVSALYHIMWPVSRVSLKKSYPALDSVVRTADSRFNRMTSSWYDGTRGETQSRITGKELRLSLPPSLSQRRRREGAARAFQNPRMLAARILKQKRRDNRRQPSVYETRYNRHEPAPAGRPSPHSPKSLFVNSFMFQGYVGDRSIFWWRWMYVPSQVNGKDNCFL